MLVPPPRGHAGNEGRSDLAESRLERTRPGCCGRLPATTGSLVPSLALLLRITLELSIHMLYQFILMVERSSKATGKPTTPRDCRLRHRSSTPRTDHYVHFCCREQRRATNDEALLDVGSIAHCWTQSSTLDFLLKLLVARCSQFDDCCCIVTVL